MATSDVQSLYKARQARLVHPDGYFEHKGGQVSGWWPSTLERCDCCAKIESPTKKFPYSLMRHCRTKAHIKRLLAKQWIQFPVIPPTEFKTAQPMVDALAEARKVLASLV